MKIKTHCKTRENYGEIVKYIEDFIKNNEEIIVVNIGTDRCIGDAVAPIVGTMLKENECLIPVYGTISEPIHALNLDKNLEKIKQLHPNAKVIGIDACLGDNEQIGEIQVRDYPVRPGKGVGKSLPSVGDISIIGVTASSDDNLIFGSDGNNVRLDLVYKISSLIVDSILEATNSMHNNIKFYNNTYDLNKNNENTNKEIAIN